MSKQACWEADPYGRHQLRYWNGEAWTEHVSDDGSTAIDPPGPEPLPPPAGAVPPPPAAGARPAAPATSGGSWKDRLKQAAQQAVEQGKELGDKAKAAVAEQQAKRADAAASDPDTVWVGQRRSAAANVGVVAATYRITRDAIYLDAGVLASTSNQVPLWAVRDVDVRQSITQKGKNVGDVIVHLGHPRFYGEPQVTLDNIEGPYEVRDLLNRLVRELRGQQAGARSPLAPTGAPQGAANPPDLVDQLRRLADLRDQGILTEEEFTAQKQRLLGS